MKSLLTTPLPDPLLERMRQNLVDVVGEIQRSPLVTADIRTVSLEDGVETPVAHGLKRHPVFVTVSCVRGPSTSGHIEEVRSASLDRAKYVVLKASGYGATVSAEVLVL